MVKTEKTPSQRAVDWLNKKTEPQTWPQWVSVTLFVLVVLYIACRVLF